MIQMPMLTPKEARSIGVSESVSHRVRLPEEKRSLTQILGNFHGSDIKAAIVVVKGTADKGWAEVWRTPRKKMLPLCKQFQSRGEVPHVKARGGFRRAMTRKQGGAAIA